MSPRDRVLTALNHHQPDRIPVDLSGHRSSGIAAMAYARLRDFLSLPKKPIRVYDPIQQLAIVDEDILQRFQIDTIELGRAFALEDRYWSEWSLPDGTPCLMPVWAAPQLHDHTWIIRSPLSRRILAHMPKGVFYFEQTYYPFAENDDLDHIEENFQEVMWAAAPAPPGPIAGGDAGLLALACGARELRAQTDRAIIGLFGGNLLESGQMLYRNDNFLMLLAGNPDHAALFLERLTQIHLRNLERFLSAVAPHIDIILFGDDLGMQTGPQISPAMYCRLFQPHHRRMWSLVKERAPHLKIMLHCCGGVRELLPHLIDAGLDAINPVQITCRGMDPASLKSDFGQRLTFWGGGCDTRDILSHASPAQIRDHVRRLMDTWASGGGYVFQQVHNILADVPPENIVAMLDSIQT